MSVSEISKLYENAGVEPVQNKYIFPKNENWVLGYYFDTLYNALSENEKVKVKVEPLYPPFTAEKQIEILKLLTNRCDLTISHFTEWEFIHFDGQEPTQVTGEDFAETFAKLINAYWQSLTEEEKQQVKGILE